MAAVTKAKQVNNNNKKKKVKDVKTIEIVSRSKYEKLERKYKRLARNQDKTVQRVEDLEDTIKLMRWQDTCKNGFIFNYLKPRHKPRIIGDGEPDLWSDDGKHYYALHELTLDPVGFTRERFSQRLVKAIFPGISPFGYMDYNKPMSNERFWKLEGLAENIAGRKCHMNFSDPKEDEEFDRICRNMA